MTTIPFFQIDAFAPAPLTGNPAAVMPLERWLDDAQMQAIAAENNLAETAFTVPTDADDADYELRWFTPTVEVNLCGHATLAAAHALLDGERIRFATRSGVLTVTREGDRLAIDMPARDPVPGEVPGLAEALGVAGDSFVSREGNGNAIVLLSDEAAVRAVQPDFAALAQLPYLVSVTAPGDRQDIASRVFAGYHGVPEDPVTGSAHTALVPLWATRLGRDNFTALQASRRGGILHCRLTRAPAAEGGDRVILGGQCRMVIVGSFEL